ncbi:MAG TPA: SCO family protein [Solirubrobacteraceae bacterium]|nr:SCO family protein [Solirubrobacteraceae bacterium]
MIRTSASAALLAVASVALAGCGASATRTHTELEGALIPYVKAPAIALHDVEGGRVSLASLHGHVVLLSFLYSRCGAPCEVIAQQMRGALEELPADAAKVVIVSARPASDSAASVRRFLERTGLAGRALYLTGSERELAPLYAAYRVHTPSRGRSEFDSYAFVMVISKSGRERALFESEELTPEALAKDIRSLGG